MRTLALSLLAVPGCLIQHTTVVDHDDLEFDEPVDVVEFDLGAGDLSVALGSDRVEVSRTLEYTGEPPDADAWVDGGVLFLDVDCRSMQWTCRVDHTITLPSGAALVGDVGSGAIDTFGLVGDVDVTTGSGDITLAGGISSNALVATGSGSVDIELIEIPSLVAVDTGSGDVTIVVPAGAYRVRTDTGSGDVRMQGITADPGASAVLEVSTGSGDIHLVGR